MAMRQRKILVLGILTTLALLVNFCASGFYFIANQYAYYRLLKDAGLPYEVNRAVHFHGNLSLSDDPSHDERAAVQAETARLLSLVGLTSLISGLFSSVVVGRLSDQYGRRLAIGVVLLGQGLHHAVIVLTVLLELSVTFLILGSFLSGVVGGGMISFIVQVNVCFTDLTRSAENSDHSPEVVNFRRGREERRRLLLLGTFDTVIVLAAAAANSSLGSLLERFGFSTSVITMIAIFVGPVIIIWLVPETNPALVNRITFVSPPEVTDTPIIQTESQHICQRFCAVWIAMRSTVKCTLSILASHNPESLLGFSLLILYVLIVFPEGQFLFLYLMSKPFSWTPEHVGLYNGFSSLLSAGVTMLLTAITVWSMKPRVYPPHMVQDPSAESENLLIQAENNETVIDIVGSSRTHDVLAHHVIIGRLRMMIYVFAAFFTLMLSKLLLGFAFMLPSPSCTQMVFVSVFLGLVRASLVPTLKSFFSAIHPANTQGHLFSLIGVCEYAALLVGLPGLPAVYSLTVSIFPGAVFLATAGLAAIGCILTGALIYCIVIELRRSVTSS
ncbi:Adenylate cyclase [Paragonimus heterotremus]|uniref:Adenylate cyclase n=1 Tax=Paragonimus heterotremus TaxID=100268 RepID=A0A8J4WSH8_9TREM|nr:Adenylate cyclase [Paragonimus heterotremus]